MFSLSLRLITIVVLILITAAGLINRIIRNRSVVLYTHAAQQAATGLHSANAAMLQLCPAGSALGLSYVPQD